MALSIKSDEADRLARELAAATGETLTEAVVASLRERLERYRAVAGPSLAERVRKVQAQVAALPILDDRAADDVIGYDGHGAPR